MALHETGQMTHSGSCRCSMAPSVRKREVPGAGRSRGLVDRATLPPGRGNVERGPIACLDARHQARRAGTPRPVLHPNTRQPILGLELPPEPALSVTYSFDYAGGRCRPSLPPLRSERVRTGRSAVGPRAAILAPCPPLYAFPSSGTRSSERRLRDAYTPDVWWWRKIRDGA